MPDSAVTDPAVDIHAADLPAADEQVVDATGQIDMLLDMTVSVTATLGQTEISVRDLLRYGPGTVLKLDRLAGEPVDLYLRGVKFAVGDLVVVGEQLGVRIREVLPQPQKQG